MQTGIADGGGLHPLASTTGVLTGGSNPSTTVIPLQLTPPSTLGPRLQGEIRDLLLYRLVVIAGMGAVAWLLMTAVIVGGVDVPLSRDLLGGWLIGGMAAAGLADAAVAACLGWRNPSLTRLRLVEVVLFGKTAVVLAWLRGVLLARALEMEPADGPYILPYVVAFSNLTWMSIIVIYGVFIPNTWSRTLWAVGGLGVLVGALDTAVFLFDPSAGAGRLPAVLVPTSLALFLSVGIAVFGSFKMAELHVESVTARRQARELGQYRLVRRLGAGAMGEVYLAEHSLLRRPCAVKLIRPVPGDDEKRVARFEREVQATAALTHPNAVQVYDYGRAEDGTFYYAMEYLPGLDLDRLVERHGPLPPGRAIHLLRQVCGALREAHAAGLIHRDVKPGNVIVCERGGRPDVVKLLDFGLVRAVEPDGQKLTQDGAIAGTPAYMSPEQAEGAVLDGRSDLYSLGAVGYYLLTGRPPFLKGTALQMLYAHVRETVRLPTSVRPGVPADLEAAVLRCLEKDRGQRFPDAQALDDALAACQRANSWSEVEAADWWREHGATTG
jgi:serine/threonine-protein kinase